MMTNAPIIIGPYRLGKTLGIGAFGKVKRESCVSCRPRRAGGRTHHLPASGRGASARASVSPRPHLPSMWRRSRRPPFTDPSRARGGWPRRITAAGVPRGGVRGARSVAWRNTLAVDASEGSGWHGSGLGAWCVVARAKGRRAVWLAALACARVGPAGMPPCHGASSTDAINARSHPRRLPARPTVLTRRRTTPMRRRSQC